MQRIRTQILGGASLLGIGQRFVGIGGEIWTRQG